MTRFALVLVALLLVLLTPSALGVQPAGTAVLSVPASKLAPLLVGALRTPDGGYVAKCGPVYVYFNWTGGREVSVLLYWFARSLDARKAVEVFNACLASSEFAARAGVRTPAPAPLAEIEVPKTLKSVGTLKVVTATPTSIASSTQESRVLTTSWDHTAFGGGRPQKALELLGRVALVASSALLGSLLAWLVFRRLL